jgi:2,3-dihydroxyphenylpropionate 1,2-dioxygenase
MTEIVIGAALSHSPVMNFEVPAAVQPMVEAYRDAVKSLAVAIKSAKPDVLIVIAQDHFKTSFYQNMPAFLVGVGEVSRIGDWQGSRGPLLTDTALARHSVGKLFELGFEPAVSYDMKVDHGITQVLELLDMTDVPVIPVQINAAAPPLPSPARCYAFGEALRKAVSSFGEHRRIAVVGSGGLSHAPLKVSIDTETNQDMREFLIHGRVAEGAPSESDRIKGIMGRLDQLAKAINPEWDRLLLRRFEAGQAREVANELSTVSIEVNGGRGGQEIRSWLAMLGATQAKSIKTVFYQPIPHLVTGMGALVCHQPQ